MNASLAHGMPADMTSEVKPLGSIINARLHYVYQTLGHAFNNLDLVGEAMLAPHSGDNGLQTDGNRELAAQGIRLINKCHTKKTILKHPNPGKSSREQYELFNQPEVLVHVMRATGLARCIVPSPRQGHLEEPVPKVMTNTLRALIAAVYVDSNNDLGAVWRVLDNLLPFAVPCGVSTGEFLSDEGEIANLSDLLTVLGDQIMTDLDERPLQPPSASGMIKSLSHQSTATSYTASLDTLMFRSDTGSFADPTLSGQVLGTEDICRLRRNSGSTAETTSFTASDRGSSPESAACGVEAVQIQLSAKRSHSSLDEKIDHYLETQRKRLRRTRLGTVKENTSPRMREIGEETLTLIKRRNTVRKLFYAPTSSFAVLTLKASLVTIKKTLHAAATGLPGTGLYLNQDVRMHYERFKALKSQKTSNSALFYHIYKIYQGTCSSSMQELNNGFIHAGQAEFKGKGKNRPGNALNLEKSHTDDAVALALEPTLDSMSETDKVYIKREISNLRRLGDKLAQLVADFGGEGFLLLLPNGRNTTDNDTHCMAISWQELKNLPKADFGYALNAMRSNKELLRAFGKAAEPLLHRLFVKDGSVGRNIRMEMTSDWDLGRMFHGSVELLSQFDLV